MTNPSVEPLWLRIRSLLAAFAVELRALDRPLAHTIARSSNDAFLLRGYLAFRKQAHGDEVAITVDVRSLDGQLILESDACMDDGRVIAAGPSAQLPLPGGEVDKSPAIENWLREFEQFLNDNALAVSKAVAQL